MCGFCSRSDTDSYPVVIVRSHFSFVPSHETPQMPQPNPNFLSPPKHINSDWVRVWIRYTYTTHSRLNNLQFQSRTKFVSVYMIPEFNFFTGTRISFRVRTGMNSFQNDLYQNKMLFRYHVIKYREIIGDGMNSFQNESHSSIM